jgi:hypothetical protein
MRSRILQFWNWFSQNEAQFRIVQNEMQTRELLNNQILDFGNFAWGVNRGKQKPFSFVISPNNSPKLLAISKEIVQLAPNLPKWEFHYCKLPDLDWDFQFQMFNSFMIMQSFDASKWEFVLIEEEDYRIRVEIKANNMATLDYEDQMIAADRAVTRLLGEEMRIEEVHSVAIIDEFDPRDEDWIYSMREFRKRFIYFIE